jgi:hypothetical protein
MGAKDRAAMTPVQELTDEQFQEHALSILERELGLDGLVRFLRIYRPGTGDYTAERHKWLAGITVADITRELDSEG